MSMLKEKEAQAERLSDDLKARISEIHLRMLSGDLTAKEMAEAREKLEDIKLQMANQLNSSETEKVSQRRIKGEPGTARPPA